MVSSSNIFMFIFLPLLLILYYLVKRLTFRNYILLTASLLFYAWLMNLFTVWLLTGIWHGANWTFILWGLFYFVLLVIECETKIKFGHVLTMLMVIISWVIFRNSTVAGGVSFLAAMFGLSSNSLYDGGFVMYLKGSWPVIAFGVIAAFPMMRNFFECHKLIELLWLCLVFVISSLEIIGSSYNPFIYFNF